MKCPTALAIILIWFGGLWLSSCNSESDVEKQQRVRYLGLRERALQGSRAKFGLPAPSESTQPWGVVIDFRPRFPSDVLDTAMALSDGTAAVYVSRGPDPEGLAPQEAIRKAAKRTVNVAGGLRSHMHKTTKYPLPGHEDEVIFYILTDSGVYSATAWKEELENNRHPLSKLWDSGVELGRQFGWH